MGNKTIEETFQKKDLHQHILARPETYVGSTKVECNTLWIVKNSQMIKETLEYCPAFIKLFDECLVNAIDHSVKDPSVTTIKVNVDCEKGSISVFNNGAGIPVVKHKEYKIYIPSLIFGNLLTSSNYDDSEQRITGGLNGLGIKLCNIFSQRFEIETVDAETGLKFIQIFEDNMFKISEPKITKSTVKPYTKVTFVPDFKRFGMKCVDNDALKLIEKRTYDTIVCTNKNVNVYFNDEKLKGKSLIHYTTLFEKDKFFLETVEQTINGITFVWEYAVAPCDHFEQISFVNGIATTYGGTHVTYILNQIVKKLSHMIETKKKTDNIKPSYIKDHLFLFVKAVVVNPDFSSQSKETLTTPQKNFVKIEVSDSLITKLYKSSITDDILSFTKYKNQKELAKTTDGKRQSTIKVEKLEDAHRAGTADSRKCSLILTEGDSAKSFAISGLSVIGRDYYGVFPLRGKLLNVREATQVQLLKNEEVNNLKKILGLQHNKEYTSVNSLRYGSVILLTDQDLDGYHIRGLIINFIHYWWPTLLFDTDFVKCMKTPIVKISKGINHTREFFTVQEYKEWEKQHLLGYTVKYYKGLGTSTSKEAKDLFRNMKQNVVQYTSENKKESNDSIILAFDKKKAEERKAWLQNYNNQIINAHSDASLTFTNFVNKELIHFSMYDIIRSIPSICDGLKPSQRKVLFTCFKRNLTGEAKVAQLGASVAEHTNYHHGEQSLFGTIINMAQTFVGSNNWNLLSPCGQFGTRLLGGKDAASPRYIFTKLEERALKLFDTNDDEILKYNEDDGKRIEPVFFVPTFPMVLVNGCQGIGTGYSTFVPCYNPKDILKNIKLALTGQDLIKMKPWYNGFKGTISETDNGTYIVKGKIDKTSPTTLTITELPIGVWTDPYKDFIEGLIDDVECKNHSTEEDVNFVVKFPNETKLTEFLNNTQDLYKFFKLSSSISVRNMHLFDYSNKIKKYETAEDIVIEFVKIRLKYNVKRKKFLQSKYKTDLEVIQSKIRFLMEIMTDKLVIYKKKKIDIDKLLEAGNYLKINENYNYLTNMPIHSFTYEKINDLNKLEEKTKNALQEIESKSPKDIFYDDLSWI